MTYDLEHFKEFHDDPASFSDEDFRTKTLEWMVFVRETKGQYDFESDEWCEIGDRFYDELDARFPRTEELEEEYENLKTRLNEAATSQEMVEGTRNLLDFLKLRRVEFQFSQLYITRVEDSYAELRRLQRAHQYEIQGIEYEKQQALFQLDDALANYYEKTGRIRSSTTMMAARKHKGN